MPLATTTFDAVLDRSDIGLGFTIGIDDAVEGIIIVEVSPESPAAAAGLKSGDIITQLNGVSMAEVTHETAVSFLRQGQEATLTIVRGQAQVEADACFGAMRTVALASATAVGLELCEDEEQQVRVFAVQASATVPLEVGDVVLACNGCLTDEEDNGRLISAVLSGGTLQLVAQQCLLPMPAAEHTIVRMDITLTRQQQGQSLGFSFETFDNLPGVYVKRVREGGLAEMQGQLKVHDRIVEVREGRATANQGWHLTCLPDTGQ